MCVSSLRTGAWHLILIWREGLERLDPDWVLESVHGAAPGAWIAYQRVMRPRHWSNNATEVDRFLAAAFARDRHVASQRLTLLGDRANAGKFFLVVLFDPQPDWDRHVPGMRQQRVNLNMARLQQRI